MRTSQYLSRNIITLNKRLKTEIEPTAAAPFRDIFNVLNKK